MRGVVYCIFKILNSSRRRSELVTKQSRSKQFNYPFDIRIVLYPGLDNRDGLNCVSQEDQRRLRPALRCISRNAPTFPLLTRTRDGNCKR